MQNAVRKLEKLLHIEKPLPKLKKGESDMEYFIPVEFFNNASDFNMLASLDDAEASEIAVIVRGYAYPYIGATQYDPPEGGYTEEAVVYFGGEDITEMLTEKAYEKLLQEHYEHYEEVLEKSYAEYDREYDKYE